MLGISVSKFHELVQLLREKIRIEWTLVWKELPVNHTLKIPPATQHYFGAEPIFFSDDFSRLSGTEPFFRSVRVGVIDPFFITCDNSPDKSIIHGFTDTLMTEISTLRWACWGVNSKDKDLQLLYDFSKCLNLGMYRIVWCTKFFWQEHYNVVSNSF